MKTPLITLTLITLLHTTQAATIILDLYEGAGGDGVLITATISDAPNNGVEIMLRNESTIRAVVTSFAIQDANGVLSQPLTSADWAIQNSINIPASSNINFETTFGFKALPPPTRNGINAGEDLLITLMDEDINDIIYAFNSGNIRIAMHVQSIGADAISSSYVTRTTITPEPSTPMLLGLAGVCLLLFRKRDNRK